MLPGKCGSIDCVEDCRVCRWWQRNCSDKREAYSSSCLTHYNPNDPDDELLIGNPEDFRGLGSGSDECSEEE